MKARLFAVMSAALILVSGCVSEKDGNQKIANEYEQFKKSLPPAAWQPTGVRCLDDIGVLSAKVYQESYNYMNEYISASENQRFYQAFINDVALVKEQEKLDDDQAAKKVLSELIENDKTCKDDDRKLPRVIEGINAVQALDPVNKIKTLSDMLPQVESLITRAKNLPNEIKRELSNDPFKAASAAKSADNVLKQLEYTSKMIGYIRWQYVTNQELNQYEDIKNAKVIK